MADIDISQPGDKSEYKLTLDIVKDLWSKTYNTEGKPDWSHILPYYDNDIYFKV